MAVNEGTRRIVGGVDTHKDLHVAAVVDEQDRVIATKSGLPAVAIKSVRRSGTKD